ncbi:MAG: phospho-sugar mutase [Candidatus Izemoplasmatales bacterium]|nr:phospho-sugar mutase [Candidatus Izemoplasmatales bacterium]
MWRDHYERWLAYPELEPSLRKDMEDKTEHELEEMFHSSLGFGTGGMRGILGAGTNRLNVYTIRKANDGLARYLVKNYRKSELIRGVCIAYDNRKMSKEFAIESAKVLGYYGIKSYLFDDLRPTPELSFAVRHLKAIAGIVITASHNPPNYNGYKIYDDSGCQYTPFYADQIVSMVEEVTDLFSVPVLEESELKLLGLLEYIGKEIDDAYVALVKTVLLHPTLEKKLKVVFTPLHGTSRVLGARLLEECGFTFFPVMSQFNQDSSFSTVKSPNPESPAAFEEAIKVGNIHQADLLIATDPDADRLGIAIKQESGYLLLSGNQTGAILIDYLLKQRRVLQTLPKRGVVFNTIVTSDLGAKIAREFGYDVISTLTGFKFIGEQAKLIEKSDVEFLFGYEESYGYVVKDFVRDKDSLQAMMLAVDAANYYLVTEGKTLVDKLHDIYKEYGYYLEALHSIDLFGIEGAKRINRIVEWFRNHPVRSIAGNKVDIIEDYETGKRLQNRSIKMLTLPRSNVIKTILENGDWFVLRPSGTEPKLKLYVGVTGQTLEEAQERLHSLSKAILAMVEPIA